MQSRGIVEFKGIGCFDDTTVESMRSSIFLAEEFMPGGTLKNVILNQMRSKTRRLYSMEDAWRWLLEIAEALCYLHNCSPSVVHRDVKPENVLMSSETWSAASAKIADFGLHKRINKVTQMKRAKSTQVLQTNDVIEVSGASPTTERRQRGTQGIAIPTVGRQRPSTERTDLSRYKPHVPSHFRIIKKSSSLRYQTR